MKRVLLEHLLTTPRDRTRIFLIVGRRFTIWTTKEVFTRHKGCQIRPLQLTHSPWRGRQRSLSCMQRPDFQTFHLRPAEKFDLKTFLPLIEHSCTSDTLAAVHTYSSFPTSSKHSLHTKKIEWTLLGLFVFFSNMNHLKTLNWMCYNILFLFCYGFLAARHVGS